MIFIIILYSTVIIIDKLKIMKQSYYIYLSTIFIGYYWVCCVSQIITNGFQNNDTIKWWNILIFISFIQSIFYNFYILYLKDKHQNIFETYSLNKRILIYTIISSLLLLFSSTVGYRKIIIDIDSQMFSTMFFCSIGLYSFILLINLIYTIKNLYKSSKDVEPPFLHL